MIKNILVCFLLFFLIAYSQQFYQEQPTQNQQEMQYHSMRRTACLVLSRYHSNSRNQQISQLLKGMTQQDQQNFINKLYAVAVQTCEPKILELQVQQFFIQNNENFDPRQMFYILDDMRYEQILDQMDKFTPNQQAILKFIKNFDQQMQIRKEEQQAEKLKQQGNSQSEISVFGLSGKDLPPVTKYIYLSILFIIMGAGLYYGFSQIGNKPQKKPNKRRKKQ